MRYSSSSCAKADKGKIIRSKVSSDVFISFYYKFVNL